MSIKNESSKNNKLDEIINNTLSNLKKIVDSSTVIGEPITISNTSILPIVKISMGFVSGGGEIATNIKKYGSSSFPFAGGSTAGVSVDPLGMLCIKNDGIEYIKIDSDKSLDDGIKILTNLAKKVMKDVREEKNK